MMLTYFMAAITLVIAASVPPLVFAAETFQSPGSDWLAHICASAIRLSRRFHRLVNQGVAAALARLARELARSAPGVCGNCERNGISIYRVTVPNERLPGDHKAACDRDRATGLPDRSIPPGVSFAAIPATRRRPDCGTEKTTCRPHTKPQRYPAAGAKA